ncbi:MAG: hypothetical protein NTZ13_01805 [Candidatus Parcubacteria bacterium]|nr:hypothetical protein [Candidatus Parcubacteria bacterium]
MRYSVCIIDDEIPVAGVEGFRDTELLNSSNLGQLLRQNEHPWTDEVVKHFVQTLLEEKEDDGTSKWDVYAFTNPALYINHLENGTFRPDLLVFDWDYSTGGVDSEARLKEILERTFCLVFVFSKADREDEINAILSTPEFLEYQGRVSYLKKGDPAADNVNTLLEKANEMDKNNFSFKFAGRLRRESLKIMDRTLSDLGKATVSDIKNYLALEDGEEKHGLIDFIADRFRSGLVETDFPELTEAYTTPATTGTGGIDNNLVKKIWAYRLYRPLDGTVSLANELVRRGDIIKYEDNHYLVVSAACDLKRFWKKNFGTINLLPLHRLHNSNTELKDLLSFCLDPENVSKKLKTGKFQNLTGRLGDLPDGPFILPFLKENDNYECFVVLPKEMSGHKIPVHRDVSALELDKRKEASLKYEWLGAEKLCSVSEPFLSAIIQHTFGTIGGYGTPDYPKEMKKIFEEILDEFTAAIPAERIQT